MSESLQRGQRWRAYPKLRYASQIFIRVTRVARDGSWADIRCYTWAVMWPKRQQLRHGRFAFPAERFDWDISDLSRQEMDWAAKRREAVA